MWNDSDSHDDEDLQRAIELSKKSYEVEQKRREIERASAAVNSQNESLIELQGSAQQQIRQQQIDEITRLYSEMPATRHINPFAPSTLRTPSPSAEWCTIRFPKVQMPQAQALPRTATIMNSNAHLIGVNSFGAFPQMPAFYAQSSSGNAQNGASSRCAGSFTPFNSVSTITADASVIVPFGPLTTRFLNGDLIDLGHDAESNTANAATYEQICDEFDPLCARNRSNRANSITMPQSRSSGLLEDRSNTETVTSQPTLERSHSINSTHSQLTPKPGRPPPPKPQRQGKVNGRSGSVDSKRRSYAANGHAPVDVNDLKLREAKAEVDHEIASLKRRGPSQCASTAGRFISPVLDYLITGFNVTSVKVIVEKDYSWPSMLGADDKMVFTCETQSTIEEILVSVLSFFLDPAQVELHNGRLPVDEYGLKIFGLDEFLLNSSQLGENPFVGQALAFGKDIRLEVGKTTARPYRVSQSTEPWNADEELPSRSHHSHKPAIESEPLVACRESVQRVIEAIKKEMNTCAAEFARNSTSKCRHTVKQSIKLLCTLLGKLMTPQLIKALRAYLSASTVEQLDSASQLLIVAVHNFIGIYCRSTHSSFDVCPLRPLFESGEHKRREVVGVEERLLVHVESIHNLNPQWRSRSYSMCVAVYVMHGTAELCRGFKDTWRNVEMDAFFAYCHTNTWAAFDLPLCVLPRETRILVLVYGLDRCGNSQSQAGSSTSTPSSSTEAAESVETALAYASFPLFDHEGVFRQGSLFLPLTPLEDSVVQPWGPRPLFENRCEPTLLITLPEFHYEILFPYVGFGEGSTTREFETLDEGTQQYLLDIVEGGVTHSLSQDEKEVLWEKRHYLTRIPTALPLVLASAVGWDWASLNNIYQLLDDWMPLSPVQAIELLLPNFPDVVVREKAITWLKGASSAFLFSFLPQLVEALRFEMFENSSLAAYLLHLSAEDRRFAFEIYWQLQQRIDHCIDHTFAARCANLQKQICVIMDELFIIEIGNQHLLVRALDHIASDMSDASDSAKMYSVMQRHLSLLDARILENNVRLPILPSFLCTGVNVSESNFFNSLTKPMKISFRGLKSTYGVLYKVGDDMRQDALVLQLVKVMNDIWLSQELDLRMIIFRCMPVGYKKGMIELVPDCRTLREIQSAVGAAGVFKDDVLKNWLEKQNPSEFQYKIALENFQLSCAGWCVATYVLGIGDRHNDNILVTTTGHVFHIDFGKYMGDWQMAAGFRRDRVPFIFTSDMAYVINEGSSQSATSRYQSFVDNCCKAFNLLRKKYSLLMNLMKLISCSNVPGMGMGAINFVQSNLLLNLSDTEATAQFTRMIQESLKSKFPRLNFFAHTLVQLKNSPAIIRGGCDDPNKLSFVPQLYTERDDGRIESVVVLAFEKWHMPDKVYMYKLQVKRRNENVCTIVYRSFAEFKELYVKLMRRFPITCLPPLSRGTGMGRSNVCSVAQRRRADIQQFLNLLFECNSEIAHCDLVYTFFHMIFRDSAPEQSNRNSQFLTNAEVVPSTSITGSIFLRLSFNERTLLLSIFVGHVKDLVAVNGQVPDSYVKTYLQPDPQRTSKRKTRVVKNTQMPTFNEELNYQLKRGMQLAAAALDVSVWNCGSIVGENCMIGMVNIPLRRLNNAPNDRKGVKTLESWFQLSGPTHR
uniref:Phosphatidylinositol-4-phosphate 3-kinase C2 domain-containing subunit alpha n=2 Tax=Ascaris TaxID=6251 RepID=F1KQX4_ASCSU